LVVKKIGSPSDPELAIGAVAPDSVTDIDWQMAKRLGVDEEYINSRVCELGDEIATAEQQYRLHDIPVKGAHVILTDDGIATGATVRVAVRWLREMDVASVCLAVPVLPAQEIPEMTVISDRLVYAFAPQDFGSVGSHFEDFSQVGISEVLQLLEKRKE
jgi:putative phosphoribosyl transferase